MRTSALLLLSVTLLACKTPAGSTSEAVTPDLALPANIPAITSGTPLVKAALNVSVTPADVSIDGQNVASLPADKRAPNELMIPKLANAVNARDAGSIDARLIVDGATPYHVLTEVIFTLGQSRVTTFRFVAPVAGGAAGARSEIDVELPKMHAPRAPNVPSLGLMVILGDTGYSIKAVGGNVAPGCADVGAGAAIPKAADGSYASVELGKCLTKLRGTSPDFAEEKDITIVGGAEIPFREILVALDVARGAQFTHALIGVGSGTVHMLGALHEDGGAPPVDLSSAAGSSGELKLTGSGKVAPGKSTGGLSGIGK